MQSSKTRAVNNILNRSAARRQSSSVTASTSPDVIRGSAVATTTGYEPISSDLCRVRVEIRNSNTSKEALLASIQSALGENVQPVEGSFQLVVEASGSNATREYIGLVSKGLCTRSIDKTDIGHRYAAVASNVLMDSVDDTVWNMTSTGSGALVLSRQVEEDLSELLEMARYRNSGNRNYKAVLTASATTASYARFYNSMTKTLDHGYVCGREENGDIVIASRNLEDLVSVDPREVICASNIHLDNTELEMHRALYKGGIKCPSHLVRAMRTQRTGGTDNVFKGDRLKALALATDTETPLDPNSVSYTDMREYYRQMYAYSPEYYEMFEKLITDSGF